jgi:hypothetical protein
MALADESRSSPSPSSSSRCRLQSRTTDPSPAASWCPHRRPSRPGDRRIQFVGGAERRVAPGSRDRLTFTEPESRLIELAVTLLPATMFFTSCPLCCAGRKLGSRRSALSEPRRLSVQRPVPRVRDCTPGMRRDRVGRCPIAFRSAVVSVTSMSANNEARCSSSSVNS